MWLTLAFTSAALLGFYDAAKKQSLTGNAVLPVLLLNTLFSSLVFLPALLSAECGLGWFEGTVLEASPGTPPLRARSGRTDWCCLKRSSSSLRGFSAISP